MANPRKTIHLPMFNPRIGNDCKTIGNNALDELSFVTGLMCRGW